MSRRRPQKAERASIKLPPGMGRNGLGEIFRRARELAARGDRVEARRLYGVIGQNAGDPPFNALLHNDLAVLDALGGDYEAALRGLEQGKRPANHAEYNPKPKTNGVSPRLPGMRRPTPCSCCSA